jgi:hypothetical protein
MKVNLTHFFVICWLFLSGCSAEVVGSSKNSGAQSANSSERRTKALDDEKYGAGRRIKILSQVNRKSSGRVRSLVLWTSLNGQLKDQRDFKILRRMPFGDIDSPSEFKKAEVMAPLKHSIVDGQVRWQDSLSVADVAINMSAVAIIEYEFRSLVDNAVLAVGQVELKRDLRVNRGNFEEFLCSGNYLYDRIVFEKGHYSLNNSQLKINANEVHFNDAVIGNQLEHVDSAKPSLCSTNKLLKAGHFEVVANRISGRLQLILNGRDGLPGEDGEPGAIPSLSLKHIHAIVEMPIHMGRNSRSEFRCLRPPSDHMKGIDGGPGKNGKRGSAGQDGGIAVIRADDITDLDVEARAYGGLGGEGGNGGMGGVGSKGLRNETEIEVQSGIVKGLKLEVEKRDLISWQKIKEACPQPAGDFSDGARGSDGQQGLSGPQGRDGNVCIITKDQKTCGAAIGI